MRVIAGKARSLRLKTPAGTEVRPTTDRIKETLFNIIQAQVPGSLFIDLFAGSGGIGIEALSRGARYAYFADNSTEAAACIRDNLTFTKLSDNAALLRQDAALALRQINEKEADIIFMDPPYQSGCEEGVFGTLREMPYVTENTMIILEAEVRKDMDFLEDMGFEVVREKKYRTNKHVFIRKRGKL
ncbi:MAG: 16S rRNA (guanine(966)-N(2))-methyltransferase RsmD [Lachnospiraceae bacterium]|nr:16S rRNA (guanine(966)-N(2))-methyltransferase RsmD [Lachnospiraceae bacterium]